jgi:hypothetical protein
MWRNVQLKIDRANLIWWATVAALHSRIVGQALRLPIKTWQGMRSSYKLWVHLSPAIIGKGLDQSADRKRIRKEGTQEAGGRQIWKQKGSCYNFWDFRARDSAVSQSS